MSMTAAEIAFYRVQDRDGRGPWKPGFSHTWVEDRQDHDNLIPWYFEMGPVHLKALAGEHVGSACETIDQLRRWFTPSEYATLKRSGYQAVRVTGRILGKSSTQVVIASPIAFAKQAIPIELHALVAPLNESEGA